MLGSDKKVANNNDIYARDGVSRGNGAAKEKEAQCVDENWWKRPFVPCLLLWMRDRCKRPFSFPISDRTRQHSRRLAAILLVPPKGDIKIPIAGDSIVL